MEKIHDDNKVHVTRYTYLERDGRPMREMSISAPMDDKRRLEIRICFEAHKTIKENGYPVYGKQEISRIGMHTRTKVGDGILSYEYGKESRLEKKKGG